VPGWKFSVSASALATSCWRIAAPLGDLRFSVTDFLLRASDSQTSVSPHSLTVPSLRHGSPTLGCSTLITSAPNSAMMVAQYGAAM
jgi:hypothetical protein